MTEELKLEAAPVEPVAWMYTREGSRSRVDLERGEGMTPAWTETPLYALPEPAADLVEVVARAIWNSNFHPSDVASGEAQRRIADWPEDWSKAKRQARAAILALKEQP